MMFENQSSSVESVHLEDYIQAIKRHWPIVLLVPLILIAGFLWLDNRREHSYEASARVALGPSPIGSIDTRLSQPSEQREAEVAASTVIAMAVAESLQLTTEPNTLLRPLDVTFIPDSGVLRIAYTDTDPENAAELANAFASEYTDARESAVQEYYGSAISILEEQKTVLVAEISEIAAENATIAAERVDTIRTVTNLSERDSLVATLDDKLIALRTDSNALQSRLRTTDAAIDDNNRLLVSRQTAAQLIGVAEVPTTRNGVPRNQLAGALLVVGLLLGSGGAFLLERLNTTARDEASVGRALGASVVGNVPAQSYFSNHETSVVMLNDSRGLLAQSARESIRRLRTAVQFLARERENGGTFVLALTSAHPSEGKSFVSSNLAVAIAQAGSRVLLINADMRRPTLEKRFGLPSQASGLSSFLGGDDEDPVLITTETENLWILAAGPTPSNPSELLSGPRLNLLFEQVRGEVDVVLIDTPPVLAAADALTLRGIADGVVVVVNSRSTSTEDLLDLRSDLERAGFPILGAILNKTKIRGRATLRKSKYAYLKE